MASASPRVECKVVSSDTSCMRCAEEDQVSYCIKNGWKQQIHCVEAYASNETQNYIDAESTSYYTYQPCPISFDRFVRFETFMLLCAVFALFYVQRRKRWLVKIQQYRISAF